MPSRDATFQINETSVARRFQAWMAQSVFSIVCLAAIASTTDKSRTKAENWSLAVSIISMLVALVAVVGYLNDKKKIVSSKLEWALVVVQTVLWAAGLPVIMNPANGVAMLDQGTEGVIINNANLYFFSWLSFIAVLYITGSLMQERAGYDPTDAPPESIRWYGLCASSLVVVASAVRLFKVADCHVKDFTVKEHCNRVILSISVGSASLFLAVMITYAIHALSPLRLWLEALVTTLLLTLWCFCIGFTTFGNTAPGASISNLYFSAWISFILVVFLFSRPFRELLEAGDVGFPTIIQNFSTLSFGSFPTFGRKKNKKSPQDADDTSIDEETSGTPTTTNSKKKKKLEETP